MFSKIYKFSPGTNLYKTKHIYTNIKHKIFEELVPLVLLLLSKKKKKKKHICSVNYEVDIKIQKQFMILQLSFSVAWSYLFEVVTGQAKLNEPGSAGRERIIEPSP